MKNLLPVLSRLAVVLTGALALGSCSRAEYAFLPKSASYLGTTAAAPKARAVAPTPPSVAQVPAAAVAPEITVATTPAPSATKAAAPVAAAPTPPASAEATAAPPALHKPNLVQRLALAKVTKKLHKLAAKTQQFKQGDNTASTTRGGIDSRLRYAIIFGAISLIFFVLGGTVGNLVGTILLIIAILFLLFWLLDNL